MTLPLEKMTKEEKLQIMEALWIDLTKYDEEFLSPNWHEDILKLRENRVQAGHEKYLDWDLTKKKLHNRFL